MYTYASSYHVPSFFVELNQNQGLLKVPSCTRKMIKHSSHDEALLRAYLGLVSLSANQAVCSSSRLRVRCCHGSPCEPGIRMMLAQFLYFPGCDAGRIPRARLQLIMSHAPHLPHTSYAFYTLDHLATPQSPLQISFPSRLIVSLQKGLSYIE